MQDNYLAHHGILGQKWGVRRFQNEDGTLTAAGKERYHIAKDGRFDEDSKKKLLEQLKNTESQKEIASDPLIQRKAKTLSEQAKKYRDAENEVQKKFKEYDKKSDDEKDQYIRSYVIKEFNVEPLEILEMDIQDALKSNDDKTAQKLMAEKERIIQEDTEWLKSAWPGSGFEEYMAQEHPEVRKVEQKAWDELTSSTINVVKGMVGESDAYEFRELTNIIRNLAFDLNGLTPDWRDSLLAHGDISLEKAEEFIAHHGILGQKWGVRRFQNEDGTLTEEGKKRYGDSKASKEDGLDNIKELSDDELKSRISRLQQEVTYQRLVRELDTPIKKIDSSQEIKKKKDHPLLKQIFVTSAATAMSSVMTALATRSIQNVIAKTIVENPDKLKKFYKKRDARDQIFNTDAYLKRQKDKSVDALNAQIKALKEQLKQSGKA